MDMESKGTDSEWEDGLIDCHRSIQYEEQENKNGD